MPKTPEEPYEAVVSVLAHAFRLRRSDAMPRAVKQVREWRSRRKSAIRRSDTPTSHALRSYYRILETLIQKNIGKYYPKDGSKGPTPELAARPSGRDGIGSLEDAGRITGEQAAAAREIQRIVEIITTAVHPKCQTYQKGAEGFRPGSFMSAESAYRWSQVYVPWHAGLKGRRDKRVKQLAEKVILEGYSLDRARCQLRMSYERGHAYLVDALDLYIEIKGRSSAEREKIMLAAECEQNTSPPRSAVPRHRVSPFWA